MENKTTYQLMREFMENLPPMTADEQAIVWNNLNDIILSAKERVVEDAEKAVANLRTFSLR